MSSVFSGVQHPVPLSTLLSWCRISLSSLGFHYSITEKIAQEGPPLSLASATRLSIPLAKTQDSGAG